MMMMMMTMMQLMTVMALTFELVLDNYVQCGPSCQISELKVILFSSYHARTRTHTHTQRTSSTIRTSRTAVMIFSWQCNGCNCAKIAVKLKTTGQHRYRYISTGLFVVSTVVELTWHSDAIDTANSTW